MKRALAMALICSALAHSQELLMDDVLNVRQATILLPDAGVVGVDGGVWLSDARSIEIAKERVSYKAEHEALKAGPAPVEIGAAFVVGVALGAIVAGVVMVKIGASR